MIRIGHNKELILTLPRLNKNGKNSGYYSIVCFGRKRHYRKDGSCSGPGVLGTGRAYGRANEGNQAQVPQAYQN